MLSIWCRACWPLQYYLYMQLYHTMALRVAAITKLTLNMLDNGDAGLALYFGHLVSNLRLLSSSSDGWYTVNVSAYLKSFALDEQMFVHLVVLYVLA